MVSERAAQLARIIADSGTSSNRLPTVIMDRYTAGETVEALADDYGIDEEQIEWGIRIAHLLEQANLARGLALEQAAQMADGYFNRHPGNQRISLKVLAREIRSLDPDAAQALAAHDKEVINKFTEGGIFGYINEIERRARLDEAKWWQKRHSMHHNEGADYSQCGCEDCQHIAALAESHPQGITDIRQEIYSQPAPCGNCGHPIFAHGRNGCTHYVEKYKAECGCLGGEVRPAPAKEPSELTWDEDQAPCPVCGNELRHQGTGLLSCECPAPAKEKP